jgi:dTDP-4-amino-4,6-dideoxygalactose transaminase
MVVTPHRHLYEKLLTFRTHGITKDESRFAVFTDAAPWHYEMQELGYNYRLTDIQAAIGKVQMSRLEDFITARNRLAQRYVTAFGSGLPVRTQQLLPQTRSAYHLFPIWFNPEECSLTRRQLFDALVAEQIRPQVHYIPVHLQPYYQQHLDTRPGDYPNAERYYEYCLSLPLYPTLTDDAQDHVIACVKRLLQG